MINTIVGAGAASRYGSGSGSDQMMRLRLRNTDCARAATLQFGQFIAEYSIPF
jgi:hypothetical protein